MSFNIKNADAHRLAKKLADLTGESMTAAVTQAIRERLERALKVATGLAMNTELLTVGELSRSMKVEERIKARRIWDRRGEKNV